jgi:glycosyltransferase involved in cell wall biosynthesis
MRIAQISTLGTPVRRDKSGSIEAHVWLLTRELTRLGHEVTVFASAGSETDGELVATLPGPYGRSGSPDDWHLCEWINLCRGVEQARRFDVLHSHAYLWGLPLQVLANKPMVHTLHVMPGPDEARLWSCTSQAHIVALSAHQWSAFPHLVPNAVISHGLDAAQFSFRAEPADYVCYLGRFNAGKGPLQAIEAARAAGVRLLLAGPQNEYYHAHIAPLVDGTAVEYIGSVTGPAREGLLGGARALLYPLVEPEPFGLVMAEAMMCGTPVVALRTGAVPEIVQEGVTGYTSGSTADLPQWLRRSFSLDRHVIRDQALARFSAREMARSHEKLYERLTAVGAARSTMRR